MKMKKTLSVLCSAAVLLTSVIGGNVLFPSQTIKAEEQAAEETGLSAPQNLRYEDGDIVWDEVEGAYGYELMITTDIREYTENYYTTRVEMDRFLYELKWGFDEYTFKVRAFDQQRNMSEWSKPVTAEYVPTIDAPANVRASDYDEEETVEWDEVEGAYQYNIRVYDTVYEEELYYGYERYSRFFFPSEFESGDYLVSVQAMDQDYRVSQWTEPILISHVKKVYEEGSKLDTPQNVRFDESGDNIIWDEVEGADYYVLGVGIYWYDDDGNEIGSKGTGYFAEKACYSWKRFLVPLPNIKYRLSVCAWTYDGVCSDMSEELYSEYKPDIDESIKMPEKLRVPEDEQGQKITWDPVENAVAYYITVETKDERVDFDLWERIDAEEDYHDDGYRFWASFPYEEYEVTLYVLDKNYNYNKKTYNMSFGIKADENVWVPEILYKFEDLLWDFDEIRQDDTQYFWVRIRNAEDNTLVKMDAAWYNYSEISDLPNGKYLVDLCAYVYDRSVYRFKVGPWSNVIEITVYDGATFDKGNEVSAEVTVPEDTDVPEEDRVTTVTVNPSTTLWGIDENGWWYDLDLSDISVQASEIYDEEGLKRAEEALGEALDGNTRYNLLDLTLLYNGQDFSNSYEGLVQVIISLPQGHLYNDFSVYRIVEDENGNPVKEEIPGERVDDTYVIYLEHFSQYALVGTDNHEHDYGDEWESDKDGHWQVCKECGKDSEKAEHKYGEWKVTKEATETEDGSKERVCETCGYKQTEAISKLAPADSEKPEETEKSEETDKPVETEKPDDTVSDGKNPVTGAAAAGVSALVLSACGAAAAYAVKKRNKK